MFDICILFFHCSLVLQASNNKIYLKDTIAPA